MSVGSNNTLVLFDNLAAQDLLSKAKVCLILFFCQMLILIRHDTQSFVDVPLLSTRSTVIVDRRTVAGKREGENETDLIEGSIAPAFSLPLPRSTMRE